MSVPLPAVTKPRSYRRRTDHAFLINTSMAMYHALGLGKIHSIINLVQWKIGGPQRQQKEEVEEDVAPDVADSSDDDNSVNEESYDSLGLTNLRCKWYLY